MSKKNEKSILITGASKGIGYETASKFVKEVEDIKNIILVARKSDHFDNAVNSLKNLCNELKLDKNIYSYNLDVGDRQNTVSVVKEIAANHSNIDILVNNAGYTNPLPIHRVELDDFDKTLSVNLFAPFIFVQQLLFAGNRFDCIVNIASTAGINGRSGWLTYSASKAALINMSDVLREELSVYGTRVICLSPGRTATDLRKTLAPDEDPSTIMQPKDVAEVIKIMCSNVGQFIDSENVVVRQ